MLRMFSELLRAEDHGGSLVPRLHHRTKLTVACVIVLSVAVGGAGAAGAEGEHRVRNGETLAEIAGANHTTVRALAQANGLSNPNRILVGQVLVIPGATAAAPSAPATVVHVVAPGETLSGIASRYGTTSSALASANRITNRNLVRIGQRLTVTAGGGSAATPATTQHTVSAGETLASIAGRYGTTVGALVNANGIRNPNLVRIGQQLTVTAGGGGGGSGRSGGGTSGYAATGGSTGVTGVPGSHTVASGESLTGIARRYGVSVEALAAANGVLRPWNLYAGARLLLSAPNRLPVDISTCPVAGATFANDWGLPRSGGRAHAGNDMFASRGTPVVAPVAGSISFATGTIGGHQFRLVGDDGMVYLGSHMDGFGTAGRVGAGTVIGYVGNTGNAAGGRTHLHFEVHPDNGPAMNPYPVIRPAC
jgi:N-acetylmuramoyl-L-alanine amidase